MDIFTFSPPIYDILSWFQHLSGDYKLATITLLSFSISFLWFLLLPHSVALSLTMVTMVLGRISMEFIEMPHYPPGSYEIRPEALMDILESINTFIQAIATPFYILQAVQCLDNFNPGMYRDLWGRYCRLQIATAQERRIREHLHGCGVLDQQPSAYQRFKRKLGLRWLFAPQEKPTTATPSIASLPPDAVAAEQKLQRIRHAKHLVLSLMLRTPHRRVPLYDSQEVLMRYFRGRLRKGERVSAAAEMVKLVADTERVNPWTFCEAVSFWAILGERWRG